MINHIDLTGVLRRTVCDLYSDLVTRPTGAAVRDGIEKQLADLGERSLTVIDFSHVRLLDYSCADEIVAKLLMRYAGLDATTPPPRDAYFINVSRGAVLREADLVAAIDAGHLAGAALDVYATEPLPVASELWRHPKILCTPHVAAEPRPEVAAAQFLDNLRRARRGELLANVVDRERGY